MKDHGRYNTISNAMEFLDFLGANPHWFSVPSVCSQFGISNRTAQRWLSIAESRGWVEREVKMCRGVKPRFRSKIRLEER